MKIHKKKGFNIQPILDRLSEKRTLNPDGSIQVSGFGLLEEFESYLRTAVAFEGRSDAFARRVVKKAMNAEQRMTEQKFVQHCIRISQIESRSNLRLFKVLFPIWGSISVLSGRRRWGDVSITFDIQKNSKFARRAIADRANQLERYKQKTSLDVGDFENLPLALCSAKGIDIHDAFEQAERAISKELGLYSLISPRNQFIFSNDPDKPINTILLAPHMTAHDTAGAIASDIFWYNRWSASMTKKARSSQEVDRIVRNVDRVRSRLRKLPWREKAEEALLRHYSAFSQFDLEASFLDGWRLLESIGGNRNDAGEILVKRAAWFFEDREFQYQVGRHLMERRNLISHGRPVRDENDECLAFQMKKFLTPLLHALLTNPFDFESIEEFWGFCDLPVDRNIRLRRAYLLDCSSKFRREVS